MNRLKKHPRAVSALNVALMLTLLGTGLPEAVAQSSGAARKKVTLGDLLRKAKEESRGANVNQIEKKTVVVPKAAPAFRAKPPVNLNDVKPPATSTIYSYDNADQAAYEKTLDTQINELYKLTQKFKSSPSRGELWLRLAELYVEKAGIVDARKQDEYDRRLKEFQSGKTRIKPVLDSAAARDYNKKAIQLYEWFLRDYPNDPKVSQALFFLGYNNFELGNAQDGARYYSQLTRDFPDSPFSGEAHFALGENLFENEKWAEAYKEYSYLIKDNRQNLHRIALYKGAWCLFRLGKTEEGIKYLDYIVKSGRGAKPTGSAAGKRIDSARLESEALKDLVVFFADTGDTSRAIGYFRNVNGKESLDSLERLAYYLSDRGNREGSRDVFRYLISRDPNSRKAFEYQYQIVQNYFFAKNSPEFKAELYKWISGYNPRSSWYALHKSDQAFIIKSNQLREQTLRNYVLQQHQTAQNSRAAFSQQNADEGYKLYFQEFGNSRAAPDMHFFYGELLYDMKRYADAANEYTVVVVKTPTSPYAEKASQNIILALEKTLPADEELQKRTGNSLSPVPLDKETEKFIKTANWYLQKYPNSDRAAEIKFRVGRLYYLTNNFDPAEKQFREIVQQHPKTKYSEYSANLLLDIYNLKKDYAGLEKMGSELLADGAIANTQLRQDIRGVMEKASFKQAQDLEGEKKYLESAGQYQSFGLQNPASNLAGIAFFNAGVNFERSGKTKEAADNYRRVVTDGGAGSATVKPKAKRLLAKIYQDAGRFDEAGQLYSELFREYPADPLAANYVYNSALMKEITGRSDAAVEEYGNYLKINKGQADNADVMFRIAELRRGESKWAEALTYYRRFVEAPAARADKKIEAHFHLVEISVKMNTKPDLTGAETRINALLGGLSGAQKEAGEVYLAKIKLLQAEETFIRLKAARIPDAPAQQKAAIDRKLELMGALNEQLSNIIRLDSAEEIVGALYLLGEANEHMAQSFRAVPVPASLSPEQRQVYLGEVEKIVTPFINKSDESYKLAVERGQDLQVYSDPYLNAFRKMNVKYPQQYYNLGESAAEGKLIDWGGGEETSNGATSL